MGINNLFNNVTNKVSNFVNDKKKEHELYSQAVDNSLVFKLDNIITKNKVITSGNYKEYMDMCSYISYNEAITIDCIILVNETVINVFYITQKIDNKIFVMVLTNYRIIVMNEDKYGIYDYLDINKLERISSNLFTQIINFNGIVLGIDINSNDLNIFYNLIVNTNYRNSIIIKKTKYLCGINPIYQRLNKIQSGISIDNNKNVVFHDRKVNNYLCRYDDILNYELLEDNTPVLKRKTNNQDTTMKFAKKECTRITLRVTLNNNQTFEINILEPKIFNDTYSHEETTYRRYYEFGKEIINKLDSLNDKLY